MPIVIDPSTKRDVEVSESQFRALLSQVSADTRVGVSVRQDAAQERVVLWDAIDGTALKSQATSMAQMLLREVVCKCSACNFTSAYDGAVRSHVEQVRTAAGKHLRSRLITMVGQDGKAHQRCTGCLQSFQARKSSGQHHLDRIKRDEASHGVAIEEVLMHRYSLTAGTVTELGRRFAALAIADNTTKRRKVRNAASR